MAYLDRFLVKIILLAFSLGLVGTTGCRNAPSPSVGEVKLERDVIIKGTGGLLAYRISTPTAIYYLEEQGFGLSRLLDRDGIDWLGFEPTAGSRSAGEFRGFPNAVNKQAGDYFHPMNAGTQPTTSSVDFVRPDHVRISGVSENGLWRARYDFFPTHCTFTMTAMPEGYAYWVLYEGTPGGSFELDDWWVSSAGGERKPMTVEQQGDLPGPEWIAFGDRSGERAVLLFHHEDDKHPDNFYQMENNMTVFGFGRQRGQKFLASVPRSVSIGFVDRVDQATVERKLAVMKEVGR